jgi:hypothetical protein
MTAAEFYKENYTKWSFSQWLLEAVFDFAESFAASETAAEKPERDNWILSINLELSNLRDWANREAKRAEAAERERDAAFELPLTRDYLETKEKLAAAEAERDRAVRALQHILKEFEDHD